MILPDVNLLVYATDQDSESYGPAKAWLETALSDEQVFFSWHTITGFLRIITNPRASQYPLSIKVAVGIVDEWLSLDNTHIVNLEKKDWRVLSEVLVDAQANGNLVMDAHLAALSTVCGAQLATSDRDFARFSGIKTVDPLSTHKKSGR